MAVSMQEYNNRSILDYVRSKQKSDLCRFIFFAATSCSAEEVLKTVSVYARENFGDRVTGLMIVYSTSIVHVVESDEDEIFRACSYMVNLQPRILTTAKYFPMELGVQERFFEKWYGRRVAEGTGENELEMVDLENFEEVTNMYRVLSRDLFSFFNELGQARKINRACLMEKLEKIGSAGDSRLPTEGSLRALLNSSWGDDLEELLERYRSEIRSRETDDDIWPFPERWCTSIETTGNT